MTGAFDGDPAVAVADAESVDDMGAMAAWFQTCETLAHYRLGRWDDAVRTVEAAGTTIESRGGDTAARVLYPVLGVIRAERGDVAGADDALRLADMGGAAVFNVVVDWSAAVLHTIKAEYREGIGRLRAAAARESANERLNFLAMILAQLVDTATEAGDAETARAANDRLQALPRDDAAVAMTMWCWLAQAVAGADAQAASSGRDHALRYGLRFDAARALAQLGTLRDDAGLLVDAYDEFGALGAVYRQRQVAVQLRRLGRRAPRRRTAGGLTPVEAQIADLVATGLTNRQVADKAGLSPKTVEVYLSRIYAKTGCQSRVELAVAVNSGALATS
jgi:DNA-binding CsgD family transcriptional regulator